MGIRLDCVIRDNTVPDGVDPDGGEEGRAAQLVQAQVHVGPVREQQRETVRVFNSRGAEEWRGAMGDIENIERDLKQIVM